MTTNANSSITASGLSDGGSAGEPEADAASQNNQQTIQETSTVSEENDDDVPEEEDDYIVVADREDDSGQKLELPAETDGTLTISTLAHSFPEAIGLKYRNPVSGIYRALAVDSAGTRIIAPKGGWAGKTYVVIRKPKESTLADEARTVLAVKRHLVEAKDYLGDGEQQQQIFRQNSNFFENPREQQQFGGASGAKIGRKMVKNSPKNIITRTPYSGSGHRSGSENLCSTDTTDTLAACSDKVTKEENLNVSANVSDTNFDTDTAANTTTTTGTTITEDSRKTCDLVVLNLPFKTTSEGMRAYFEKFGEVVVAEIKTDFRTGQAKGFGFVQMHDFDVQCRILEQYEHLIDGRLTQVKIPNSRSRQSGSTGRDLLGLDQRVEQQQQNIYQRHQIVQQQHPSMVYQTPSQPFLDTSGTKIYVGRLPAAFTQEQIRAFFDKEAKKISPHAQVDHVLVPKPHRGFAFVTFNQSIIARKIIKMTDFVLDGVSICVSSASPKEYPASVAAAQMLQQSTQILQNHHSQHLHGGASSQSAAQNYPSTSPASSFMAANYGFNLAQTGRQQLRGQPAFSGRDNSPWMTAGSNPPGTSSSISPSWSHNDPATAGDVTYPAAALSGYYSGTNQSPMLTAAAAGASSHNPNCQSNRSVPVSQSQAANNPINDSSLQAAWTAFWSTLQGQGTGAAATSSGQAQNLQQTSMQPWQWTGQQQSATNQSVSAESTSGNSSTWHGKN